MARRGASRQGCVELSRPTLTPTADDYDPRAVAKAERKARSLKNEGQRLRNVARAAGKPTSTRAAMVAEASAASSSAKTPAVPSTADNMAANAKRSSSLKADLIASRKSTASMGKYDRKLAGEAATIGRERGQKRKFESNERSGADERERGLDTLSRLGKGGPPPVAAKRAKPSNTTADGVNVRKAIRSVSRGGGSAALAGRGRGGSSRGRGGSSSRGRGGSSRGRK